MPRKPILCLDFDGVLHSYTSGWRGADVVADPPVPGALEFLAEADKHFEIHIFSSRTHQPGGWEAMQNWLWEHVTGEPYDPDKRIEVPAWLMRVQWPKTKPSAFVTLDDRALTFTGEWPSIESLKAFKPWNKP